MAAVNSNSQDRRWLLNVTAGNLRNNHLYVHRHYDFFPDDVIGGPRRTKAGGNIQLLLDGLHEPVTTDIGRDAKMGKLHR